MRNDTNATTKNRIDAKQINFTDASSTYDGSPHDITVTANPQSVKCGGNCSCKGGCKDGGPCCGGTCHH